MESLPAVPSFPLTTGEIQVPAMVPMPMYQMSVSKPVVAPTNSEEQVNVVEETQGSSFPKSYQQKNNRLKITPYQSSDDDNEMYYLIEGETYKFRSALFDAGAIFDPRTKEWFIPFGDKFEGTVKKVNDLIANVEDGKQAETPADYRLPKVNLSERMAGGSGLRTNAHAGNNHHHTNGGRSNKYPNRNFNNGNKGKSVEHHDSTKFQTIVYHLPRPAIGMFGNIRIGEVNSKFVVVKTWINNEDLTVTRVDFVKHPKDPRINDKACSIDRGTIIIVDGRWQVMGIPMRHSVFFEM